MPYMMPCRCRGVPRVCVRVCAPTRGSHTGPCRDVPAAEPPTRAVAAHRCMLLLIKYIRYVVGCAYIIYIDIHTHISYIQ